MKREKRRRRARPTPRKLAIAEQGHTMTDELESRLKEIDRRIEENTRILRERAPNADPAVLASAAKYREVLERLAKE